MTLLELLALLATNTSLEITLVDSTGDTLITFNAPGYTAIESDLGAYSVTAISVNSKTAIGITIAQQ